MKEQEILQAIAQDMKIGCWEADMTHRRIRLSEVMRAQLGAGDQELSFEDLRRLIPCLNLTASDVQTTPEFSPERSVSFDGPDGQTIFTWKAVHSEIAADGRHLVSGYIRIADSLVRNASFALEKEQIGDLLSHLNNISRSLLSLLHTDKVDDAVNKVLHQVQTLFGGSRAYIVEFDWDTRMHLCSYEVTADHVEGGRDLVSSVSMEETPWWTQRISEGHSIMLSTLNDLPEEASREKEVLEAQDIKSLIVLPLVSRDSVRGYVGIDLVERQHNWTNQDYQWFSSLVNIISLCLELQRSEQEAQSERDYMQGLYRHMPIGYVRLGMLYDDLGQICDYSVIDANYAADTIIGIDHNRYIGRRASELGVDMKRNLVTLSDVLRTGIHYESDDYIKLSGHYIHTILYTIRKDEVICLFSDTTDVREAHETLGRNEKLLRNIFDNIQIGVELYDKEGKLVDINNKDMEIFGVTSKDQVMGVKFYENPAVPQEIRETVRAGRDVTFKLNYVFDRIDGYYDSRKTGIIDIYTTVNMLYDTQGNLVNFMLINIDNTEISRAHSRLAEFETSFSLISRFGMVGYCRYDLVSGEGYAIPQWYTNLGEKPDTPLSEVIGVYSHIAPIDRKVAQESIARIRRGEIDNFTIDLRVLKDDGRESWTRSDVMRNPTNNDPEKIEVVAVNYDITELKLTEHNLIEAKNKAEVSDRLKSAFLANMSHEIRTPLNAIVGFSNLICQTDDQDEQAQYLHIVEENNELLLKLISDILDLSRIEAGTFDFVYDTVDVNQMCEEVVCSLGLKVKDRAVDLVFGEHDSECRIYGDKNRLVQIITNFINNAVKFTPQGNITLSYRVDNGMIRFSVKDTGDGIPHDQLAAIFDRFVKLNSFAQGTGLGLSICKSIVEQMRGNIGVESEEGRGSTFWFAVPVGMQGSDFFTDEDHVLLNAPPVKTATGELPTLLVAEDTDSNFLLLSLMLRKEFHLVRATDGQEAVRLCREINPAAVLMDIKMPVMSGFEAIRCIRQENATIPIIAVTAFAFDHDRQSAIDAGCTDYMVKPLSGGLLRHKLREYLKS